MNSLTNFSFDTHSVRVTDHDGRPWFVLRDLLEAMESKTHTTDAVNSINQGLGGGYVVDFPIVDSLGRPQQAIVVAEPAATYLLARSNTERGRALNRFIHVEVLPQIRKTGEYLRQPVGQQEPPIGNALLIAESLQRMLRMSETSVVKMMQGICEIGNTPTIFLPSYVEETLTRSISDLLKQNEAGYSAVKANRLLIDLGLLEELERPSSKGGMKRFKSLTEAGLRFGRNDTSPENPRETQPRFFVDKFPELFAMLNEAYADS
jgi:prophage antirepressor-like protein